MIKSVVGLFGTCGASCWREDVAIPILQSANVEFFNPVVADWNEECMKNEAMHAASDRVVMLVITGETTAIASMAEIGFMIIQAYFRGQNVMIVLEDMPDETEPKKDEKGFAFRPNKTRKLIRQHLEHLPEEVKPSFRLCGSVKEAAEEAAAILVGNN
jgi:hypothetical protein